MGPEAIIRVALDAPLMQPFDYRAPAAAPLPRPGQRVLVPFRRGQRIGVVLEVTQQSSVPGNRLRQALACLDEQPLLDVLLMQLLEWASAYYQHPPGEVFAAALPRLLRHGRNADTGDIAWRITAAGRAALAAGELARAPLQLRVLQAIAASEAGLGADELRGIADSWRDAIRSLGKKGWVQSGPAEVSIDAPAAAGDLPPALNEAQLSAVRAVNAATGYRGFLLEGVTGSGKTEVYLHCAGSQLANGRQTLILVPEIGLTPQLVGRFRRRFPQTELALLHSGLTDAQRLRAWQRAREGHAQIIIGTRSAVFAPLAAPGLIIVDEEHDSSLKQQEGFRYSARDIAVWRARQLNVPMLLGSATPSFESLANAQSGRYQRLLLPERPGEARHPSIHLVDLRRHVATDGLSAPLTAAIGRHLESDGQVLLYLNRRGFAPALLCPACGFCLPCPRCDARMVLHRERNRVICHHCGSERDPPASCPDCGGELYPLGQGTERLEAALRELYPQIELVRLDRDTTRRRGALEERLAQMASGSARILLGTQMLTKGHDFPAVTLVGVIDADHGLFGTDFRASERLAQSFVQVAGRAGRGDRPGEVFIQTLFPEHPLLKILVHEGYDRFAEEAMAERRAAGWPPYAHLALLRAEAGRREPAQEFLQAARSAGEALKIPDIQLLGPAPAPMERRAGRFRAQLLVQTHSRPRLQQFLAAWREQVAGLPEARHTRWSLDVDPIELI